MRSRLIVGVLVALLMTPQVVLAVCGASRSITASPLPGAAAPRNAHVALTMPADFRAGTKLSLRTAPLRGRERVVVPVAERAWHDEKLEHVELVPASVLAPKTAYEVWTARGEILGVFTTSDVTDTIAPSWAGLKRGQAWRERKGRPGVVSLPPECGSPLLSLEMDRYATDDQTAANAIRYALWATNTQQPIDYTTPPLGWLTITRDMQERSFRPGSPPAYELAYGNDQDALNTIAVPSVRPLKVGVRAIDLAGNASAPSELTLP